jgi:membrane protein implicated in regulation of membrane protease activity
MSGGDVSARLFAGATLVIGVLFTVPGVILVVLGLLMLVTGESGFTDAVPWWLLLLLAGLVAVIPGGVFLFVSRRLRKAEEAVTKLNGN